MLPLLGLAALYIFDRAIKNIDFLDDVDDDYLDDADNIEHSKAKFSQNPNLVTIQQASQIVGVSEKTIRRRIKDNTLKATNIIPGETNRQILIKLDDLRKWANSQRKPINDVDTQAKNAAKKNLKKKLKELDNLLNDPNRLKPTIELTKSSIEICDLKIEELEHKAKRANEDDSEDFTAEIIQEKIKKANYKQNLIIYEAALKELESSKKTENSQENKSSKM